MEKLPKEYTVLFNAITDAAEALKAVTAMLAAAQIAAEKLYLDKTEEYDGNFPIYHK